MLDAAPFGAATAWGPEHVGGEIIADHTGDDGRHLVMRSGAALHRLWLRGARAEGPVAAIIIFDAMTEMRLKAVSDLQRAGSADGTDGSTAARPTRYQAYRLGLLLDILDLRAAALGATSHEVARRLLYPRQSIARGAAWKSSSERRRTQRLIREAEALVAGGYRALLAGHGGRQK